MHVLPDVIAQEWKRVKSKWKRPFPIKSQLVSAGNEPRMKCKFLKECWGLFHLFKMVFPFPLILRCVLFCEGKPSTWNSLTIQGRKLSCLVSFTTLTWRKRSFLLIKKRLFQAEIFMVNTLPRWVLLPSVKPVPHKRALVKNRHPLWKCATTTGRLE